LKDAWSRSDLFELFPSLRPASLAGAMGPSGPASGQGRFVDDEAGAQASAQVALSLEPARDLAVRLGHAWPASLSSDRREAHDRALLLGILKAAVRHSPPALACAVTVSGVSCETATTERAVQVAAYQAFMDASGRCEWAATASPFPDVAIERDEDPEVAAERIIEAFTMAGFAVDRFDPTRGEHEIQFTWMFTVRAGAYRDSVALPGPTLHAFFVCPFAWTEDRVARLKKRRAALSYIYGRDGESAVCHLLSAYPLPPSLEPVSGI